MNRLSLCAMAIALASFTLPAMAEKSNFDCTVQVAKGSCWGEHTVTFNVIMEGKSTQKIVLGKTEFDKQIEFPCEKRKVMNFEASINPPIWTGKGNSGDRLFPSKERWITPLAISDDMRSWAIQVCFEEDFFNAPKPISDATTCKCTFPKSKGE